VTGGRRAGFFVTAGGVYSYNPDLNGKVKYVVEIIDGYACLLHFPANVYEIVSLPPFVPNASLE
jgi:hypothetical protein